MSEAVRLYQYKAILSGRRATPAAEIMARLEISRATFNRDITKLRDQLSMPIRFDREQGGYVLDAHPQAAELPGLWFSPPEVLALVTLQHLLAQLEPGLLGPKLKPIQDRLHGLMAQNGLQSEDVAARVRVLHAGKRKLAPPLFEVIASATLGRKRLRIDHYNRQNGQTVSREVSPQRVVHYRDNWYLDAWCHLRNDLRSFAIDAIHAAALLEAEAQEMPASQIDAALGGSYGIFGGKPKGWATLRFTPERARWVRGEQWHPQQEARDEPDGSYVLAVPFADDRELIGDILRHGTGVQVIGPAQLRTKVQKVFLEAASRYIAE